MKLIDSALARTLGGLKPLKPRCRSPTPLWWMSSWLPMQLESELIRSGSWFNECPRRGFMGTYR